MNPDETLRILAPSFADLLADLAGHRCRWLLVSFQPDRAHWIVSEPEAGDVLAAFKNWLPFFSEPDHKPLRAGNADECAVATAMRSICKSMGDLFSYATLSPSHALVVFPRDVGLYGSNISRETAILAMHELLPHLEAALAHRRQN